MSEEVKVSKFNRHFVGFIAKHPILAILLGLAIVGALLPGLGKVRADFTHRGFFFDHDPKLKRFEAFERRFGNDDSVALAVHSPSGVFDLETATLIQQLTEKMWKVPEVIRVDSLANFNWVHAERDDIVVETLFPPVLTPEILRHRKQVALNHEVLPSYLVSKDGTVGLIFGRITPGLERAPDAKAITLAVRKLAEEARGGDHQIYVFGGPPITYAFEEVSTADISKLAPMAIGLAAFFLLLLLRSAVGVVLPLLVVFLSIFASFGVAGWAGLTQTAMSTAIPSILIAVGIADTVHILVTFFAALRRGVPRKQAAHYALSTNLLATFLTSLTTAVGFFSFVSASLKPISSLGIMAGCGTIVAWLLAQLVLGGLLFLLPIKARRTSTVRAETNRRRAFRFVDAVARHRKGILVGTVVIAGGLLAVSTGVDVNSDPLQYFRKDVPTRVAYDFVEAQVGSARAFELVVDSGREDGIKDPAFLNRVDQLQKWIETQPGVTRALSIIDVLKQTHRSLNGGGPEAYRLAPDRESIAQELFLYTMALPQGMDLNDRVTVKNDALRITVLNTIKLATDSVSTMQALEAKGRALGLDVQGTGKNYLYQELNGYVVDAFLTSLWSASLIIALIMALFLRSLKLGLISMIPNIVPLFAGGALLRLLGQPLDMGTVLVASVCLGISIDDTCHVLTGFARLRRQGLSAHAALREVMDHSAPALLSTNGILITSFAAFATAAFVPNFYFGVLTAFILAVALLTDMFFTPALLMVGVKVPKTTAQPTTAPALAAMAE